MEPRLREFISIKVGLLHNVIKNMVITDFYSCLSSLEIKTFLEGD